MTGLRSIAVGVLVLASACSGGDEPAGTSPADGASGLDSALPDRAAPVADAGPDGVAFLALAPCPMPHSYVTGQAVGAHTASYHPPCLRVPVGASVTIEASSEHPLEPRALGSPANPIHQAHAPASIVFPAAGFFPYQCPEHVDSGMLGVIWVDDQP